MDAVSSPTPDEPRNGPRAPAVAFLFAAALIVAGAAAYWNSLRAPLVLDDIASVAENPSIRKLWPIWTVLAPPANVGLGGRPVSNLTFALNYAVGGTFPAGYHVVNLVIHLATAVTLLAFLCHTFARPVLQRWVPEPARVGLAFAISSLWLLHPLQTEAVTYISQRTESLMGLFYLLTLYLFARGAGDGRRLWFVLSPLTCALGMATKEVMVTAPLMVLLYDRTFVSGSFAAAWRRHRGVYVALAATWALLAWSLVDVHERGVGYTAVSWWNYALTESRVILHYLRLAFWPHPLVFDYGTDVAGSLAAVWPYVVTMWLLVAATLVALVRRPVAGFAAAWVLLALAPTSSVVPVAGQPMAEHRMYLPLVGVIAFAAMLAVRRFGPRLVVACTLVLAAVAGVATAARNRDYQNALTLWSDTVAKAPWNARAHAGVGAAFLEQGNVTGAIPALERAVELDPQLMEAHNNLAMALLDAGRPAESIAHFTAALQLRPGVASTYYNFGNALLGLGRVDDAIDQQQKALALQRDFPEAECALANALAAAGRGADAIPHFEASLRLQPGLAPAHFGLANAFANAGRLEESIPHYEATLRAVPGSLEAHFNLANVFFALRRLPDALVHYEAALQLRPDLADAYNNAGNALALSGRIPEAIARYEAALRYQPDFPAARTNLEALRKLTAEKK